MLLLLFSVMFAQCGGIGYKHLKNSCFLSSSLALIGGDPNLSYIECECSECKTNTFCPLQCTFKLLRQQQENTTRVNPKELYDNVTQINKDCVIGSQCDPGVFCGSLLDKLQEKIVFNENMHQNIMESPCIKPAFMSRRFTTMKCSICSHITRKDCKESYIPISIDQSNDIIDCLDDAMQLEIMNDPDNLPFCRSICNKKTVHFNQHEYVPGNTVYLLLKRHKMIAWDDRKNIPIYEKDSKFVKYYQSIKYFGNQWQLFGILVHHGVLGENGHCSTLRKTSTTNIWYKYDDTDSNSPYKINDNVVLKQEALVLAYYKINVDNIKKSNVTKSKSKSVPLDMRSMNISINEIIIDQKSDDQNSNNDIDNVMDESGDVEIQQVLVSYGTKSHNKSVINLRKYLFSKYGVIETWETISTYDLLNWSYLTGTNYWNEFDANIVPISFECDTLNDIHSIPCLMEICILEQILCTCKVSNYHNELSKLLQFRGDNLKDPSKSVYNLLINNPKKMAKRCVDIAVEIASKMRIILYRKGTIAWNDNYINYLFKYLYQIYKTNNRSVIRQKLKQYWNVVRNFRLNWNESITTKANPILLANFGYNKENKNDFAFQKHTSILGTLGIIWFNNKHIVNDLGQYQINIVQIAKLTKQLKSFTNPFAKKHKNNLIDVTLMYRTLDIYHKSDMKVNKFSSVAPDIVKAFTADTLHSTDFIAPVASPNSIKKYEEIVWDHRMDNINRLVIEPNLPVSISFDVGKGYGSEQTCFCPVILCMPYKGYIFHVTDVELPAIPIKENKELLVDVVYKVHGNYPGLVISNWSTDSGPKVWGALRKARSEQILPYSRLILFDQDEFHGLDITIKTPAEETYGYIYLWYDGKVYKYDRTGKMLRLLWSNFTKNQKCVDKGLLYVDVNQWINAIASANSRWAGLLSAVATNITNKGRINANIKETEVIEHIEVGKTGNESKQQEMLLSETLQHLSNINVSVLDDIEVEPISINSNTNDPFDFQLKPEEYKFNSKGTQYDYIKPLLILDILVNNDEINTQYQVKILIQYLSERINIGDWINIECVGKVVVQPAIVFLKSTWNRFIEYQPMIGNYYKMLTEMMYSIGYLITCFDADILDAVLLKREDFYMLPIAVECRRKVCSSGNIKLCKKKVINGYLHCSNHPILLESYLKDDENIQKILPLLLPSVTKAESFILDHIFTNIVEKPNIDNMDERLCHSLLNKYYFPLFQYVQSELFKQYQFTDCGEQCDIEQAKYMIFVNSFIFIYIHRMKFKERMINSVEPALAAPFWLGHPQYGPQFASNIVQIGFDKLIESTTFHLRLKKPHTFQTELREAVKKGYRSGAALYSPHIWLLVLSFAQETDPQALYLPKYEILLKYMMENTSAKMTSLPTEKTIKPLKKNKGPEKMHVDTLKVKHNNKLNMKNCIHAHPIDIMQDVESQKENNVKQKSTLLGPQNISGNDYDDCFDLLTQDGLAVYSQKHSKKHSKKNHKYKRPQLDPKKCLKNNYNVTNRIQTIGIKRKQQNINEENIGPPMKRRKIVSEEEYDGSDMSECHEQTEEEMTQQFLQETIEQDQEDTDSAWNREYLYCVRNKNKSTRTRNIRRDENET